MIGRHTFSKSERLCGEKTISRLFNEGESGFVHPFRYVYSWEQKGKEQVDSNTKNSTESSSTELNDMPQSRETSPQVAVLVSVSKRYHKKANKRNLNKRRIREAYRLNKDVLTESSARTQKSVNIALIYVTKEVSEYKTVENAVKKILSTVASRL